MPWALELAAQYSGSEHSPGARESGLARLCVIELVTPFPFILYFVF